jgi:hypothetical protein
VLILLGQLRDCEGAVLLGATSGEWRKANHEEVQAWEGNQVDSKLAEVRVQLPWEAKAAGDTTHGGTNQVVQITNCRQPEDSHQCKTVRGQYEYLSIDLDHDS